MLDLPDDVLLLLARSFLDVGDIVRLGMACRDMASLFFTSDLVWTERIVARWGKRALRPPRKRRRFSETRIPEKAAATLRQLYSGLMDDSKERKREPSPTDGLTSSSFSVGDGAPADFLRESPYKTIYAARHVEDARLEAAWTAGSFRTRTVCILDDYIRRVMPLRGMSRKLLLGTYAGKVQLVGERNGDILMTYLGLDSETICLDGNSDLVVAGGGSQARVWQTWSGKPVALLRNHTQQVIGVRLLSVLGADDEGGFDTDDEGSPSDDGLSTLAAPGDETDSRKGKVIYTASQDGTIVAHRINSEGASSRYELESDTFLIYRSMEGKPTAFHLSSDLLALGTSTGMLVVLPGRYDCFPPRIDLQAVQTIQAHSGPVRSLDFDESHDLLASGGDDCQLRLFTLSLQPVRAIRAHNHGTVAAISLDGRRGRVATGGTDGAVKVFRIEGEGGWAIWRHTAYLGSVHLLRDRLISDGFNNVACVHVFDSQ